MRFNDYFTVVEKKGVGVFLLCCGVSAVYILILGLFLVCFSGSDVLPVSVWHVLKEGADVMLFVLGGGFLWMLVVWPAWQFVKRGDSAAKMSVDAGIKPMQVAILVAIATSFLTLPIIVATSEQDTTLCLKQFDSYEEFENCSFRNFMLPKGASNIKRYYDCGFGYQSCDISCTVGFDDLKSFADAKGYVFRPLEWVPLFSESPVTKELDIESEDCTNYLYCAARNSEHRGPLPGWGDFGNLTFVYDIRNRRLYASYYD